MQDELDKLEAGFRRISPGAVPAELMDRLRAVEAEIRPARPQVRPAPPWAHLLALWRGLRVAVPAAAVVLLAWCAWHPAGAPGPARLSPPGSSGIKASTVQVGHSLVASFDTVAQVPGGDPVRFRCRAWQDDVVIHDGAHGVEVSQSTPRLEIVPVRFETY